MQPSATNRYLETDITTAPPQKLRLMLIDGAIRFIERGRDHWRNQEDEQATEALIRAQQVITELLSGLNQEVDPKLTTKVASVYLFVFRGLVEANLRRDEARLDEALKVLQVERQTWCQLCEQSGGDGQPQSPSAQLSLSQPTGEPPQRPHRGGPDLFGPPAEASEGLSLEA